MDIVREQAPNIILVISRQKENTSSPKLIANPQQEIKATNGKEYHGSNSMGHKLKQIIIYSWI